MAKFDTEVFSDEILPLLLAIADICEREGLSFGVSVNGRHGRKTCHQGKDAFYRSVEITESIQGRYADGD